MSLQVHCVDLVSLGDGSVIRWGPVQSSFFLNELYTLLAEVFVLKYGEEFACLPCPATTVTVAHFRHDQVCGLVVDFLYFVTSRSIRAITIANTKEGAPGST